MEGLAGVHEAGRTGDVQKVLGGAIGKRVALDGGGDTGQGVDFGGDGVQGVVVQVDGDALPGDGDVLGPHRIRAEESGDVGCLGGEAVALAPGTRGVLYLGGAVEKPE